MVRWSSTHTAGEDDAGIFAFERTGGDAADKYALVVLNTNAKKASSTSTAGKGMTIGRPSTTFVDALDPTAPPVSSDAMGVVNVTVKAQKTMILVPQDQLIQGV